MYHAVHAADVHKHAIAGHGLDGAGIVLTHLDALPDGGLSSLTLLILHGTDGTHHTTAGAIDLGDPQGDGLADHLAQIGTTGLTALRGGNEHTHALDVDDDTALVLLGDLALKSGFVLAGLSDILPDLHGVQTLLGEHSVALHVVDTDDVGLDLVTHLHHVLRLHAGIGGQLFRRNIACLLAAQIHLNLGGTHGRHDTGYLLSCI